MDTFTRNGVNDNDHDVLIIKSDVERLEKQQKTMNIVITQLSKDIERLNLTMTSLLSSYGHLLNHVRDITTNNTPNDTTNNTPNDTTNDTPNDTPNDTSDID